MGNNSTAQGRKRGADRIKIASFNDLFGNMEGQDGIQEIMLGELHPFKNHPFKIVMDKEMDTLMESIRQHGKKFLKKWRNLQALQNKGLHTY